MSELVVAAVDVGAVRNIGYWRDSADGSGGGTKLEELAAQVAADLDLGRRVALGFEAPLFVPMPEDSDGLNRQRTGERGRPWCAGAGTARSRWVHSKRPGSCRESPGQLRVARESRSTVTSSPGPGVSFYGRPSCLLRGRIEAQSIRTSTMHGVRSASVAHACPGRLHSRTSRTPRSSA
jgi:hypothetical protein